MRSRTPLLLGLLVPFLAVSSVAVSRFGYLTLWRLPLQDWGTAQMFADLTVAMVLVTSWIVRDARARGVAAWPFLLLTLATGSLGPLTYLLLRERAGARPTGPPPAAT